MRLSAKSTTRITFRDETLPCALVHWLVPQDQPDEDTGLWAVEPEYEGNGRRTLGIIHLDCVARAAHLLPVYGPTFLPEGLYFSDSLHVFCAFFVNRYIDHHSNNFIN